MPAPLSLDLRQRILSAHKPHKYGLRKVAKQFNIGVATAFRLIKRYKKTGSLIPAENSGGPKRFIEEKDQYRLKDIIAEKNDRTTEEICKIYAERFGIKLKNSTMNLALKRAEITRKKRLLFQKKEKVIVLSKCENFSKKNN
jgi:transposase